MKESKEQLNKVVAELQELLRKHEQDVTNSNKNLNAMQAVSNASADKIVKLESDLNAKSDELINQRRALESAWNEVNELKRRLKEVQADKDDLAIQLGEGNSKVMETESSRRDVEQREAVLRATSQQLQDSLQRQMSEANAREDRLQGEVKEMRKRWQEAITSRESLASELGNVSTPLLRQISELQESLRNKTDNWQQIESKLSERALRAENIAEMANHKKELLEDSFNTLKKQYGDITLQLSETTTSLQTKSMEMDSLKRKETAICDEKQELQSKLALEVSQRQAAQSAMRDMELRHKLEAQNWESDNIPAAQKDLEIARLKKEINSLKDHQANYSSNLQKDNCANEGDIEIQDTKLSIPKEKTPMKNLPNGEISFAANELAQQKNNRDKDDIVTLRTQISALENSRVALLDEISYLSRKNAELEELIQSIASMKEELKSTSKKSDILLVMLGEKEEELDGLRQDMREVKNLYKDQIGQLMEQLLPPE